MLNSPLLCCALLGPRIVTEGIHLLVLTHHQTSGAVIGKATVQCCVWFSKWWEPISVHRNTLHPAQFPGI